MMKACKCGSYAINHHCHGRDGSDDDLCDVCYWRKRAEQPAQQEPVTWRNAALRVGEDLCSVGPFGYYDMTAEQWLDWALSVVTVHAPPAQQEPVAVPTTSYEHRKFVLVGFEWYERFAAIHDDCQIGEQLTWQEKTIRQQGYENGWNDAQRYLKEPQATSPTPAQRKPLTEEEMEKIAAEYWLYPRKFVRAIEAAHGIKENT